MARKQRLKPGRKPKTFAWETVQFFRYAMARQGIKAGRPDPAKVEALERAYQAMARSMLK